MITFDGKVARSTENISALLRASRVFHGLIEAKRPAEDA